MNKATTGNKRYPASEIIKRYRGVGLFITGTGTDIGKTTITAALAAAFRQLGLFVGVCKPINTGCPVRPDHAGGQATGNDDLIASDATILARAAGFTNNLDSLLPVLSPIRYCVPVSPHLAARMERRKPDWRRVAAALEYWQSRCDILLVEGAGGWKVPIDTAAPFAIGDMAAKIGLPVLIVAGCYVGTINHTWLTVQAVRQSHVPIFGIVANRRPATPDFGAMTSTDSLDKVTGVPLLATLPDTPFDDKDGIPSALVQAMLPVARKYWKQAKRPR